MPRSKRWLYGCSAALLGLLVLSVAALGILAWRLPPVEEQIPPSQIFVTLSQPLARSSVLAGLPVEIEAEALAAAPLSRFELWVNGVLAETKELPTAHRGLPARVVWRWSPTAAGTYLLLVRAEDETGQGAYSNPVPVFAEAFVEELEIVVEGEGLSPHDLSTQFGVAVEELLAVNPGLNPDQEVPPGSPLNVPYGGGGATPGGAAQPQEQAPLPVLDAPAPPGSPPGKVVFWVSGTLLKLIGQQVMLAKPYGTASYANCTVSLMIQPGAGSVNGFRIYRYDAKSTQLEQIGMVGPPSVPGGTVKFDDPGVHGILFYTVGAFTALGEIQSDPIWIEAIDPPCATEEWTGVKLDELGLAVDGQADKAYCYLSADAGPWQRIPADPHEFLPAVEGGFRFPAEGIPLRSSQGAGTQLAFECWGWFGAELQGLGSGETAIQLGNQPQEVLVEGGAFVLTGLADMELLSHGGWPPAPDGSALAAPYNLAFAQNPATCIDHLPPLVAQLAGTFICTEAMADGYTALVWDWGPFWSTAKIQGYRVYEMVGGWDPQLMQTVTKWGQKVVLLPPGLQWPKPEGVTSCYAVSAYGIDPATGNEVESARSATTCWPGGGTAGLEMHALTPSNILTATHYHVGEDYPWDKGQGGENIYLGPNELLSGYDLSYVDGGELAHRYFGGVYFDLSEVTGWPVYKATLSYRMGESYYKPGSTIATNEKFSCADRLLLATSDWTGIEEDPNTPWFKGSLAGTDYHQLSLGYTGGYVSIDVTDAVADWLQAPETNRGFVLMLVNPPGIKYAPSGLTYAADDYECWTHYDSFVLNVAVFPSP